MLQADFLSGVVEGFYGRPWSHSQRLHLFDQLAALGLNTYFYAPKNDLKHRAIWREYYSDTELMLLRELVQACDRHGSNFIYGLSPGLDIRFSEEAERNRIKSRFDQLRKVGVRHFALLFDDLPGKMSDADRAAYESLAAAQCDVTNAIFAWARGQFDGARFLFCPTPYCDRMDRAQLGGAGYLDEVGRLLNSEIDILWTGPEIVSAEIPLESIERLSRRIRRSPLVWDNLFANDYDFRRLYCGPYSGRPRDLRSAVRGILVNPNNEYAINFIPLHTLTKYLKHDGEWNPREAFLNAAAEWLPCFETVSSPLPLEDLILLGDCFYLPLTEGPEAKTLLALVDRLLAEPVSTWGNAREQFSVMNARIQGLFDRLSELRDRELFDAWSRRVWELKEELQVIDAVLAQKEAGRDIVEGIELENYLPGTFRGGILAKLQRFLSMDSQGKVRSRTTP
ncbi:MAG: protein O-GlcNAcase [Planctomycetes bacterium]|nr:protein O-GlcNAcase [Planctomycetota bacterium]